MRSSHQLPLIVIVAVLISSCGASRKFSKNNKQIEKAANKANNNNYKSYNTLSYIDEFKAVAIEEMNAYGIPASITLAQGILESGSGNSDLAKYANNHLALNAHPIGKEETIFAMTIKKTIALGFIKMPGNRLKIIRNF